MVQHKGLKIIDANEINPKRQGINVITNLTTSVECHVKKIYITIMVLLPLYLPAQHPEDTVRLKLDLPLFDLPYQIDAKNAVGRGFFSSYANPSMKQSLDVSTNIYSAFHFGMKQWNEKNKIRDPLLKRLSYQSGILLGNFLLFYLPGSEGWLHEEYHRAVMSRYNINSFNGMNLFPIGAEAVSITKVEDEGLIRLKDRSPADMVRLHAAGIEGQYLLIDNLQRNNFFYDMNLFNVFMYWMSTINSHAYIFMSSSSNFVDKLTEEMNAKENAIPSRDFTGIDFTAWVYDLFRPHEPYQARGVHPSGVGINRYRTTQDLTSEELKYLKRQGIWHFVNYLSPMLYGINNIRLGDNGLTGNFAIRHLLTSFGTDITAHVYLKKEPYKMAFAYHNYLNYKHYFPAVEAELVDYPFRFMYFSPRAIIGMQPKNHDFRSGEAEFLGLLGLRVDFLASQRFLPYFDFTYKTNGWIAGNEFLSSNASVRIGLSARF